MASLLQVGLGNAAAATALALLAAVVCLFLRGRRPAVAHALWLLVLLKLLAPPLWTMRLPWPVRHASEPAADVPTFAGLAEYEVTEPSESDDATFDDLAPLPAPPSTEFDSTPQWHWVPPALSSAWLAGSLGCLGLVLVRSWRFRRLLRFATEAPPGVARRAGLLASELGIPASRRPVVRFIPGAVSPMLWAGFGARAVLLLPEGLWGELDESQRDTLVAHELAHLRRRDHWVRLVEVAATVIYWWHPAAWWARRRLREAEEQCCDAWVVWSMPQAVRHYMGAILQAVEFMSDGGGDGRWRRPAACVPPTACGMAAGDFRQLKRRLTMIRQSENHRDNAGRTLGRAGMVAACLGAAALLPLAPSVAQQISADAATPVTVDAAAASPDAVAADVQPAAAPPPVQPPRGLDVVAVPAGSAPRAVQIRPVPNTSLLTSPDGAVVAVSPAAISSAAPDGTVQFYNAPADVNHARREVERLSRQLDAAKQRLAQLEHSGAASAANPASSYRPARRAVPATARNAPTVVYQGGEVPVTGDHLDPTAAPPERDRRLEDLERKLDRLLGEVERLKEDRSDGGNNAPTNRSSSRPPVSMNVPAVR